MELSEEEKKAIKKIKKILYMFPESEELKLLLNLIDKQQKEIEEKTTILLAGAEKVNQLEKEIEELKYKYEKAIETNKCLYQFDNKASIDKFYISKDKIRDYKKAVEWKRQQEIENIGMSMLGSAIDVLNKLLEEN